MLPTVLYYHFVAHTEHLVTYSVEYDALVVHGLVLETKVSAELEMDTQEAESEIHVYGLDISAQCTAACVTDSMSLSAAFEDQKSPVQETASAALVAFDSC